MNGELSHGFVTQAIHQRIQAGRCSAAGGRSFAGPGCTGAEVNPNVLQRWRREFRQALGNAFPGNGQRRSSEGRVAELERKIGQQVVEIDFLKGCVLAAHRRTADAAGIEWQSAVYRKIG
jgi:hypothetical protein